MERRKETTCGAPSLANGISRQVSTPSMFQYDSRLLDSPVNNLYYRLYAWVPVVTNEKPGDSACVAHFTYLSPDG